jgi:hypothetical protein
MGTRGTLAVRIDGITKGSYNHWDSYPGWLGNRVLEFLKSETFDLEDVRHKARRLQQVPDRDPTPAEIEWLKPYTDLGVSGGSTSDWYCLLRETQGNLDAILTAGFYYPSEVGDYDYGYIEWSYVVDLDAQVLEIYDGSRKVREYAFDHLPGPFPTDSDAMPPSTAAKRKEAA